MAILSTTWLLVETLLIPHGFQKWYRLSFFIHPLLLLVSQIFIWIDNLIFRLSTLVVWSMILRAFITDCRLCGLLRDCVIRMLYHGESEDYQVIQDNRRFEVLETICAIQSIVLHDCGKVLQTMVGAAGDKEHGFQEEEDKKEEMGDRSETGEGDHIDEDSNADESSSIGGSSFESPIRERRVEDEREEVEIDEFYNKYIGRMEWFDLLNYERTCGISAILNEQLETSSLLGSMEPMSFSFPYISWSKMTKRKLIGSLESDFERVYVAQSCLCWEALQHQYRKVEALASSASLGGAFYDNVAGKFQQFKVLLERFLENERADQKRFWNYVQGRFSMKNLLQVPEISGYVENEEGMKRDPVFSIVAMKAIEQSIRTFWVFLKTENKWASWKLTSHLWAQSQVEDPNDLKRLDDLRKTLLKKELGMKNALREKKRCWLKRTNPFEEPQRLEVLFSMIDMKLVSRVLKMSIISTHQLQWGQEKLDDIDFENERVARGPSTSSCLFPPS